eukprot:4349289-Prorocentrum_lima.AAC.1
MLSAPRCSVRSSTLSRRCLRSAISSISISSSRSAKMRSMLWRMMRRSSSFCRRSSSMSSKFESLIMP